MPSQAYQGYIRSENLARVLRETAKDKRLRPIQNATQQKYYHASLAAYVAGWDHYVKSVVKEFLLRISAPSDPRYHQLHGVARALAEKELKKLNTPNRDNARAAIVMCTGYDPYSDWVWTRARMNATDVKEYFEEIFRVRHSFSHGFELPGFTWTTISSGRKQLNDASLARVEAFLRHIVAATDAGLAKHAALFQNPAIW